MKRLWFRLPTPGRLKLLGLLAAVIGAGLLAASCGTDPAVKKQRFLESGNSYFEKKMYSHAIIEYRNAIEVDAKFGPARKKLAEAYSLNGDPNNAFGEYIRAADLLPEDVELQVNAGTLLLSVRKPQEALARADTALKVDPNNVQANVLRGSALAGLTSFDEALKSIEGAIRLDPDRGRSYSSLGLVVLAQGKREEAETAFRRAVELSPTDAQVHLALGNFYWAVGRPKDAEQVFLSALKLDPTNAAVNRFIASLMFATGRKAEAEPYLRAIADSSKDPFGTLALADYYVMTDRPKDAISRLEALPNYRSLPGVAIKLARAHAAAGEQAKAQALVEDALKANAKDAGAQLLKSAFLFKDGHRDEALAAAQAAVAADPSSADAEYALGRLYAIRGDNPAAQAAFREALRINPRAAAAQVELARLQAQSGKAVEAVRAAGEVAKDQPTNMTARLVLVRSLMSAKDLGRAEQEIKKLRAEYPEVASVYAQEGRLALLKNDLPPARTSLERAQKLDPNSIEALGLLVSLDIRQNNPTSAKARIEERLQQASTPEVLILAARTYLTLKDQHAAEKSLRAAIDADPSFVTSYDLLGQLYLSQNKLDKALAEFETLAKRQAKPVASLTMTGMILEQQGKRDLARKRYEQVLALDSSATIAGNNLAWILADSGEDLDRALDLARTATAATPDVPQVMDTLGWVYYKKRQPLLAIPLFQKSAERDPANGWYHYHLGLAYNLAGDAMRSRMAFQQALKAGTNPATATEIGKLLTNAGTAQ